MCCAMGFYLLDAETKFEFLLPTRLVMWGSSPVNWSLKKASVCWMRVITHNMQTRLYGPYLTLWKLVQNVNFSSVCFLIRTYIITSAVR
jgi:hypothetical protein